MSKDTERLIVIGVLLWLLWPKKPSTGVTMTTTGGTPIDQVCTLSDGSTFSWPVVGGPCPDFDPRGIIAIPQ
jgi:hypothetical protein